MTYKKYLDILENDRTIEELEGYINGTTKFNNRVITTPEQKEKLIKIIIPKMIKQMRKDIEADIKYWHNAPILRVAYQYCLTFRRPQTEIFDAVHKICDNLQDLDNVATRDKYTAYYMRTKDTEII